MKEDKLPLWILNKKLESIEKRIDFENKYGKNERRLGELILHRDNLIKKIGNKK